MSSIRPAGILVEESYRELVQLLKWFSSLGPIPTIIGGWAVYFYNSYFGSMDIDIVGASHRGMFTEVIERYERTHGYEFAPRERLGLEVVSRKPVVRDGKTVGYVEIDACTFEDPAPSGFLEDPNKKLPYSLVADEAFRREVRLEEDAVCYIPSKPLLLLYKIKAARDRAYVLRRRGTVMDTARKEWLRGKLAKDRADVLALLDPSPRSSVVGEGLSKDTFRYLIERLELEFVLSTITDLPKDADSLRFYDPTLKDEQVQEWIETLIK